MPRIGYVDQKVDLFCQSVKPGVFRTKKNFQKLNNRLLFISVTMTKEHFNTVITFPINWIMVKS